MLVRMNISVAGPGFSAVEGTITAVDEATGRAWCASGQATSTDPPKEDPKRDGRPSKGEKAVSPPGGEQR